MTSDRADMLRNWHAGRTGWHYHTTGRLPNGQVPPAVNECHHLSKYAGVYCPECASERVAAIVAAREGKPC